jgi:hypothetical protein
VTGTFAGNSTDDRNITIGFADTTKVPKYVYVKGRHANFATHRFSSQTGDNSYPDTNADEVQNRIQGFSANAFQVGTTVINVTGTTYDFVAIG